MGILEPSGNNDSREGCGGGEELGCGMDGVLYRFNRDDRALELVLM
jgi:hypothetical protein